MLARAWRLLRSPEREWCAIAAERGPSPTLFVRYVVPMSALPAIAWATGLALFSGELGSRGTAADATSAAEILRTALITLGGAAFSVWVLAAAFFALAPMYEARRDWPAALAVAAYGTTPVWLAGVLLLKPILAVVIVPAMIHACVLYHSGVQRVAGVKAGDAAEFVALAVLLATVVLAAAGALLSYLNVI